MTYASLDPALKPRYRVVGELVDVRIQPIYRRFDWFAPETATPGTVRGTVEWSVLDVSTQEVIATFSTPVHEMVAAADEHAYVRAAIDSAMRRLRTGEAIFPLAA